MENRTIDAWANGFLGVVIFSGSLPATRVAVADFSPLFLTSTRAVLATLLAVALLTIMRQPMPKRADLASLAIVSFGVVVGFPLLTALALQHITSAHSIVFIGLLPLATAIFGVLRGGERPKPLFWLFSILGPASVNHVSLSQAVTMLGLNRITVVSSAMLALDQYLIDRSKIAGGPTIGKVNNA